VKEVRAPHPVISRKFASVCSATINTEKSINLTMPKSDHNAARLAIEKVLALLRSVQTLEAIDKDGVEHLLCLSKKILLPRSCAGVSDPLRARRRLGETAGKEPPRPVRHANGNTNSRVKPVITHIKNIDWTRAYGAPRVFVTLMAGRRCRASISA
jgi:hypothetical protein